MEMFERPSGYVGPNLDPTNIRFRPVTFAEGVYALMAKPLPRDNSGLIVGTDAALAPLHERERVGLRLRADEIR